MSLKHLGFSAVLSIALLCHAGAAPARPLPKSATTAQVAQAFLQRLYLQHDVERAYLDYADPDLIEHNPDIGNGVAAKIAFFRQRQQQHPESPAPQAWANVLDHLLVDRDLFAVHHHVFASATDPGRVFFDIWRVAQGRIVEHWDVIQTVPAARDPQQPPMWCGKGSSYGDALALTDTVRHPSCGDAGPAAHTQASRALIEAYAAGLAGPDPAEAVRRFNAPGMVQHSPHIAQGVDALSAHMTAPTRPTDGTPAVTIARILAQGDLVLVHRHRRTADATAGYVSADLFRVANGQIVEHWDVQQNVPATSANGHTMW